MLCCGRVALVAAELLAEKELFLLSKTEAYNRHYFKRFQKTKVSNQLCFGLIK